MNKHRQKGFVTLTYVLIFIGGFLGTAVISDEMHDHHVKQSAAEQVDVKQLSY